jgi:hypothetical protein
MPEVATRIAGSAAPPAPLTNQNICSIVASMISDSAPPIPADEHPHDSPFPSPILFHHLVFARPRRAARGLLKRGQLNLI